MNDRQRSASAGSFVLWTLLGVLVLGMAVLAVWKAKAPPPVTPEERAVAVHVMAVATSAIPDVLVLPGRVAADKDITLGAEKPGLVVEVAADKGDAVKAGQVLVRLDARVWEAARDRAKVEKADALRERTRLEQLKASGAISESDLDVAESRCTLAAVQLNEAEVHLDRCAVRSPVDGRVEERQVEPGEYVAEGNGVMRVVVLDPLKIEVDVPERDIGAVAPGGKVPFSLANTGDGAWTGTVGFVSAQAHAGSGTFRIELIVPGGAQDLRPGMIVDVQLPRGERTGAVVVPLHAVLPRKGDHIVFLVGDAGRAVSRLVRIDRIIGASAVLSSGLEPGDRLVVEGQRMLQDGMRLQVSETP
jgi:RND family efflux transporter MFP subunit